LRARSEHDCVSLPAERPRKLGGLGCKLEGNAAGRAAFVFDENDDVRH
jgi:hypothetical protein